MATIYSRTRKTLTEGGKQYSYSSLPALDEIISVRRLPVSIRIMLESLLRHCDGVRVTEADVMNLAKWGQGAQGEVPFIVSRVILQDFTGVPLLVDLAAMRDAICSQGRDPRSIEPLVPVDLVIDHSVQVDRSGSADAFAFNLETEFARNQERYAFLKWGQEAFKTFRVIPPGMGIVHQVNLENIATLVACNDTELYPDTLVGTDSHTTMINGLGVLGWGVGGIEAEAAMLGLPVSIEIPEVIGVLLEGSLMEGITATDLTLAITELLRKEKVVGKFVEFFGAGAAALSVADRATIGNMAPEYGATIGFFPPDDKTLQYLQMTGRDAEHLSRAKSYLVAQNLWGIPKEGELLFTRVVKCDLSAISPCVAGPKRPQDRIELSSVGATFRRLLVAPLAEGGYGKKSEGLPPIAIYPGGTAPQESGGKKEIDPDVVQRSEAEMVSNRPLTDAAGTPGYFDKSSAAVALQHGSVVIAAITSCTNTSNPSVMIAAGLLAKSAVLAGLSVSHLVKASLSPGSRVVTDYLEKAGLQSYLNELGFNLVAYGCTTCIGNSGPLEEHIESAIKQHDVIVASVLSGNRNFEARVHGSVKANFLMSPPLVVAFALAGRIDVDITQEPLGFGKGGKPVFLRDIWPSSSEIARTIKACIEPSMFRTRYSQIGEGSTNWKKIPSSNVPQFPWEARSTYIQNPPYFAQFTPEIPPPLLFEGMRCLSLFGDSVTTDHISPAGAFRKESSAGCYLTSLGILEKDFNSYGSRRGNHEVMMRGTFANVRIRNYMVEKEGGFTQVMPEGGLLPIYDACMLYKKRGVPLILFAGKDYGMGSSRDWAAKGTALLGVRIVVASSFERIHRTNLIGMGVLPLQFEEGQTWQTHSIQGDETFALYDLTHPPTPHQRVNLAITKDGQTKNLTLLCRIDTPTEASYFQHGGILPFVLRKIL